MSIVTITNVVLSLLTIAWPDEIFSLVIAIGLVLYAAFYYPRAVYLYIIFFTAALRLIKVAVQGENFAQPLLIALLLSALIILIAEMTYYLVEERKRSALALAEREEIYRLFVTHFPGVTYKVRVNSNQPDFLHGPFFELTGYDIEDFRSGRLTWMDVVHPEDRAARSERQQRLLEHPEGVDTSIYRIHHKSGRIRWVQEQMQILPDPSGKPPYRQGVMTDITDRRQADQLLRASEERFRLLFASMQEGFALLEPVRDASDAIVDYRILMANLVMLKTVQLTDTPIVGRTLHQIVPNITPDWLLPFQQTLESGSPTHLETFIPDLNLYLDLLWFRPQPDQVALITNDISERKKFEQALRKSQTYFRSLFENSPISLWDENFSGLKRMIDELKAQGVQDFRAYLHADTSRVLPFIKVLVVNDVNRAALDLLGMTDKKALLHNINNVLKNTIQESMIEQIVTIAEGRTTFDWQGVNDVVNGESRYHHITWTVAEGSEESYERVIVAITDVTDSKRTEAALLYLSTHDILTSLYNRAYFDTELERLARGREYPITILFADMDGLKQVNDALGHHIGDEMLRQAARILSKSFRTGDIVARIGGDEFGVILPEASAEVGEQALQRVRQVLDETNQHIAGPAVQFSIGLATAATADEDLREVLRQADENMYRDKRTRGLSNRSSAAENLAADPPSDTS